ncbi:HpaII family restriction endonuclease [Vibrio navarrensis]|uniref:HpaII family restriction endonuclease n=1 Tax=Vibrio navarrensis TaxID=29495 RepID=A0AAJ4LUA4_9VIBR|nr:HpaII family restriction endonuclease [Vibrio navarrensis]
MSIKGNIGEWSEIYTLLKVLGDEKLYAGNESLEKLKDLVYPVLKILRTEKNDEFEYSIDQNVVFITSAGKQLLKLPVSDFAQKAQKTLEKILENKKQKNTTFSIPEIENFMKQIHCSSIKASSSQKTDITIVIHDEKTKQQPVLGFSIKSQLGSPSTLLNASKATNFRFKIHGLNFDDISVVNSIQNPNKIINRISKIKEIGGKLEFDKINNSVFSNNLVLIDSSLPFIVSNILIDFYELNTSKLKELVEHLEELNPVGFDTSNNHRFYTYKIKKMLTDIALGLTPAKVWTGQYDATGGYLVVKDDGDILCYHLYNKNEFEEYLFSNTKLETASTSKHSFGEVYEDSGCYYLNLNLQIRFLK